MMFGLLKSKSHPRTELLAALADGGMELAAAVLNAATRRDLWRLHDDPLRFYQVGGLVCASLFAKCSWTADGTDEVATGYGTTPDAALRALLNAVDPFERYRDPNSLKSPPVQPASPQLTEAKCESPKDVSDLITAMQNITQETRSLPGSAIQSP